MIESEVMMKYILYQRKHWRDARKTYRSHENPLDERDKNDEFNLYDENTLNVCLCRRMFRLFLGRTGI